jgi:uncharacterized protein
MYPPAQSDRSSQRDCLVADRCLVYDLRTGSSSNRFYDQVARFSDRLVTVIDFRAAAVIDGYAKYVQDKKREPARSHDEYAIEFLMLGLLIRRYVGAAESTPAWIARLAQGLFWLRRVSDWMKPTADFLRAALTRFLLLPKIEWATNSSRQWLGEPSMLIRWLRATGEFEQEAERLHDWRNFLGTLPLAEAQRCVKACLEVFDWFQDQAAKELGCYTEGVPRFLAGEHRRRGWREDQILCAKQPVEYHLNMVAAEIMNRGLRDGFACTPRRIVLVPGCMRGFRAGKCKARLKDTDIRCAACDPTCNVNRITRRMRQRGIDVFIVPHSTGFSRWLERWQREPDCGVTAVACLLNILPGGLEMRARGIASQCVVLDYPGCKRHWDREGIATVVNEDRLVRIASASPS